MAQKSIVGRASTFFNSYFFARANLLNIGLLRIILVLLAADNIFSRLSPFKDPALTELHHRSLLTDFLAETIFFNVNPQLLTIIFAASAIGALLGILTRPSLLVFGLFIIYLSGFKTSLGVFDHSNSLVSQIILILAFIPGSTNLSVDRLIQWLRKRRKGEISSVWVMLSNPLDQIWGVRLLLILLACVYFTAGLSKVRYGGLDWLDGKTLTHYLDGSAASSKDFDPPIYLSSSKVSHAEKWKDGFGLYAYSYGNRQGNLFAVNSGKLIAGIPAVIISLSVLTVLFELSSFCLLLGRWPRNLYLFGAIFLHTSIGFFMALTFIQFRIICFLLIDWQWLSGQLSQSLKKKVPGMRKEFKAADRLQPAD